MNQKPLFMIIGFYCRTCDRPTNHGIVSFEHTLPNKNFAMLQCLECDTGAFSVEYPKDQEAPLSNNQRILDRFPCTDEQPENVC